MKSNQLSLAYLIWFSSLFFVNCVAHLRIYAEARPRESEKGGQQKKVAFVIGLAAITQLTKIFLLSALPLSPRFLY